MAAHRSETAVSFSLFDEPIQRSALPTNRFNLDARELQDPELVRRRWLLLRGVAGRSEATEYALRTTVKLMLLGFSNDRIALWFGVTARTVRRWKAAARKRFAEETTPAQAREYLLHGVLLMGEIVQEALRQIDTIGIDPRHRSRYMRAAIRAQEQRDLCWLMLLHLERPI